MSQTSQYGPRPGISTTKPKDQWCCASEKQHANVTGFNAGWLNAAKSARHLIRALSREEALDVLDDLIREHELQSESYPLNPSGVS